MRNSSNRLNKASFLGGFFVVVFFALTACDASSAEGKMVFRYNESAGIPSLDPAFAKEKSSIWVVQQLYEGLVALDSGNDIVPALAMNWQVDSSATIYTFELRETSFHNGKTLEAEDVVYSLNRLKDPKVASPGSWVVGDIAKIQTLNASSVKIILRQPNASFLSLLAMPFCSIIPKDAETLNTTPLGTGPFKFHVWHYGEKMVLHKNERYWRFDSAGIQLPYLDGISISFLTDQQSAFLEYLRGNFDVLPNLDPSFKDDLLTKQGRLQDRYRTEHTLVRSPFLNTEYLVFNAKRSLPRDLRWAINASIDRSEMITSLRNGVGVPATGGIIPAGLPGHRSDIGIGYAPDSAKSIIASYEELPALTLTTVANYRDLCEFVQGALAKLGWDIAVNVVPSAALRSEKSAGTLDFFRASWIADYPDAANYLMLFSSDMKAPNGPNYSRYSSSTFDSLYHSIQYAPFGPERTALLSQADAFLTEEAVCVPLYYDEVLRVFPSRTVGVQTNALNALNLLQARVVPD
ncbi:ABC transporter substrate-binding protein [Schleiferiaceae bacterium]|nr:ABC transporter substrate-binding protein [Schleiferiaceae bacterium]